jgi:hypothetical protein
VFSQVLTLFITPVVYLYFEQLKTRFAVRKRGAGAPVPVPSLQHD